MKTTRLTLSVASVMLLGVGFLFSIKASLSGEAEAYAHRVDQPAIVYGALALLLIAIALAFIKDREA